MSYKFKPLNETKRDHANRPPESMTYEEKMRKKLSEAIVKRIHKHIKPDPDGFDEDDVLLDREGWLTMDELKAAAHVVFSDIFGRNTSANPEDLTVSVLSECEAEAQKRGVI